jgi:hypothetical protein
MVYIWYNNNRIDSLKSKISLTVDVNQSHYAQLVAHDIHVT